MAQIHDLQTRQLHPLRSHHTFGRCPQRSDTVINNPITSRIHIALEWDGERWNARDLSKNGTWLGRRRLVANESTPLARGDILHLGAPELPGLQLVDDAPPESQLVGLNGAPSRPLKSYTFLPDADSPEAVVFYSFQRHAWMVHPVQQDGAQQEERTLGHGDEISYAGECWQVFLTDTGQMTELNIAPLNHLDDIEFVFNLSQDEENTALRLLMGNQQIDLGERSHHYLLVHLARLKATQAEAGFDSDSLGWVDNEQLRRDLGLDMSHINIMIFRARKQIAENLASELDSELLVERGKGRVRFGGSRFKIFKGSKLAYSLPG
ncbi:FHA domain-containing protein [Haliea sp. E17]|uniref:FHA domain-containing protein n=1 Tax=Haliea sp. E17 TaxID=3401576 RepID=UPI003AAD3713